MFARMRAAAHAAAFVTFAAAMARIEPNADARLLFDRHVAGLPQARLMDCDRARKAMGYQARRVHLASKRETTPADLRAAAVAARRRELRADRRRDQLAAGGWTNASRALAA